MGLFHFQEQTHSKARMFRRRLTSRRESYEALRRLSLDVHSATTVPKRMMAVGSGTGLPLTDPSLLNVRPLPVQNGAVVVLQLLLSENICSTVTEYGDFVVNGPPSVVPEFVLVNGPTVGIAPPAGVPKMVFEVSTQASSDVLPALPAEVVMVVLY